MKHVEASSKDKVRQLSCHRLPGVDIRPGLVVENIPGLSFEGYNRKPNKRITVEHVVSSGGDKQEEQTEDIDISICPTESTTSRFEEIEKRLKAQDKKAPKEQDIERYVTKEQLLLIERDLIKKRLPLILKDFNEVSARLSKSEASEKEHENELSVSSRLSKSKEGERNGDSNSKSTKSAENEDKTENHMKEIDSSVPDVSKETNKSQDEKYTSSFESITSNNDKENSELETYRSQKSVVKTLTHFSENFSDENATLCSEEELSPDPSMEQKLPEEPNKPVADLPKIIEKAKTEEAEYTGNHDYPQMLSTIEEVTTVASESSLVTEDHEMEPSKEDKLTPDVDEIDFEQDSRGALTPEVSNIDFEEVSVEGDCQKASDNIKLSIFGNRSIYKSEPEEDEEDTDGPDEGELEPSLISEGGDLMVDSSISSSRSPAASPPVPQQPPTPFQQQFEHFVVSQSISLNEPQAEDGQKTDDDVVSELMILEEGKLSDLDESELNQPDPDEDKLTPEVDEINFEKEVTDVSFAMENSPDEQGSTGRDLAQDICDEITLDVVDSIVTEAQDHSQPPGLARQDTEVSACLSDFPSLERRLSEGELVLAKDLSMSEGEVNLGGSSRAAGEAQRPEGGEAQRPEGGEYSGDVSASEGEARLPAPGRGSLRGRRGRPGAGGILETSTSSSSGLSEGEWRASPRQMQRFLNMAAAFRLRSFND